MKILHIGKYYEPHLGGIENHMYYLCHGLKQYHKIIALTYNTKNKTETFMDKGISVVKVANFGKINSQPVSFRLIQWIKKLGKEADIIHLHSPNPLAELSCLFFAPKKKLVITYHADITKQKILFQFYKPFLLKLLDKTDVIIATSNKYADSSKILSKYKQKLKIIPLGINSQEFKYESKKDIDRIKTKYGTKIVLFVGRLVKFKGVNYLIEAFKDCPDKSLLIIGEGSEKDNLKNLVRKLKLKNVHFLGHVDDKKKLINYYKAAQVFILPSISRNESSGIVILEAMACKKPIISTEINSGTSYLNLNKVTGLVIKPRLASEISNSINSLFDNPKLIESYGENAQKRVLDLFTNEQNTINNLKIYEEITKND